QYMHRWLHDVKFNELKPKTFDRKETTLEYQVYPYIGDIQINNISSNDVQALINTLVKENFSYSTIIKAF
ncbi:MAG: site-specific integrase, partial [Hyphomonadaceae bacterium]|nr:site-specific integrase [Clostridia bacterium]